MKRKSWGRLLALWLGLGLVVNFTWEMAQMSLYGNADVGWRHCFVASLEDVALLGALYLVAACAAQEWAWFARFGPWRWLALAANGALVAVLIEQRAMLAGTWSYAPGMPRLPLLGVGLVPVLQMTILPVGLAALSYLLWRGKPHE
ncbi:MAG TPA: hypothetical protein VHR45_20275 [Thermoanaerobaculia bacterium]|nr:hypothetical protein [Thermoanaerobaculia bacterium]